LTGLVNGESAILERLHRPVHRYRRPAVRAPWCAGPRHAASQIL